MAHPSIRTYRRYFSSLSQKAKGQSSTPKRDQAQARPRSRASGR